MPLPTLCSYRLMDTLPPLSLTLSSLQQRLRHWICKSKSFNKVVQQQVLPAKGDPEQKNSWAFIPFLYPCIEVFSDSVNAVHFADLKSYGAPLREIWETRGGSWLV